MNQRKARIIHTAFLLFCKNGVDKVTIRDIALRAQVGEKSVYRYFSTKKALLIETVMMLWQEIISELTCAISAGYEQKTGYEQIKILLDGFRHLYEDNSEYVLFSYDYKLYLIRHSALLTEDEYDEVLRPLKNLYLKALRKGISDKSIRVQGDVEDLYFAIWGLMRGYVVKIVIYDRMYQGKNPWKTRFDLAQNLLLGGLRNGCSDTPSF